MWPECRLREKVRGPKRNKYFTELVVDMQSRNSKIVTRARGDIEVSGDENIFSELVVMMRSDETKNIFGSLKGLMRSTNQKIFLGARRGG